MTMNGKVQGTRDDRSAAIGFHEWNLEAMDEYQDFIKRIVAEAMAIATKEYQCHAWFPWEWTGGDGIDETVPSDPTTIYVELPLGESEDENPRWIFSLSALVESVIGLHEHGDGGPISEDAKPNIVAIRDDLIRLAGVLDSALSRIEAR